MKPVQRRLAAAWQWLRAVSGDDAYERYLERAHRQGETEVLSRQEFYRAHVERRYNNKGNPARCC